MRSRTVISNGTMIWHTRENDDDIQVCTGEFHIFLERFLSIVIPFGRLNDLMHISRLTLAKKLQKCADDENRCQDTTTNLSGRVPCTFQYHKE